MSFAVRWPDGKQQVLYSPSLVVTEHLEPGVSYRVEDFVARTVAAMEIADRRVRARYGHACAGAASTVAEVEQRAALFGPDDDVTVTGFAR